MQREGGQFVNDFHMPDFDGLEGMKDMEQELQLHDIMSGNNGDFMFHCLEGGDMFYATNAMEANHVNEWQYPVSDPRESLSSVGFDGIGRIYPSQTTTCNNNNHNGIIHGGRSANSSSSTITQESKNKHLPLKNKDEENNISKVMSRFSTTQAPKTKITWSGPLHTRFLKAVNVIGIHKVTPKKVHKLMNVPGLTRRNVASHLQKYRLFLKRFADKNFPGLKDRDRALNAAFFATMRVVNTKQGATDISIPYPLSFFRTLLEWRREPFANYTEGFSTVNALSEPLYMDPSVPSAASARGSMEALVAGPNKSAPVTHSSGAVVPTSFMQNHHGGSINGDQVRSKPSKSHCAIKMVNADSHIGGNYNALRNHSTPFNPNPNHNGLSFVKQTQVNGDACVFGSGQRRLGGGINKLNAFEISCLDTTRGATVLGDIAIPSTELGQATFSSNIIQEETTYGSGSLTPCFAVNEPPAFGKVVPNHSSCQVNNKISQFPQQGWGDGNVIGAAPPAQSSTSRPLNDLLDDVMWSDEFVASLLDDIRPLLED